LKLKSDAIFEAISTYLHDSENLEEAAAQAIDGAVRNYGDKLRLSLVAGAERRVLVLADLGKDLDRIEAMLRQRLEESKDDLGINDLLRMYKYLLEREKAVLESLRVIADAGYPTSFDATERTEIEAVMEKHGVRTRLPASAADRSVVRALIERVSYLIVETAGEAGVEAREVIDVTPPPD